MEEIREIRHFHMFCGSGGGGKGFNSAQPRVGNMIGKFRCIGGIDVDPGAIHDFKLLTGVDGTLIDVFDRDQYVDFHGHEPPADWLEITVADLHRAAGNERPHIVFLSPPCKGFSGLLAESKSKSDKYRALNRLTVRGVWLMLEAWRDDPPELIILENVPRIATRGQYLLDQIKGLLAQFGYAVAETSHDCGELGGLAQSRKRFLLVARHTAKVPPFLYEPPKKTLASVGSILERMPLPGDIEAAGPMHRVPALQWKTWVRLAFVEAGSDWRSLNKLNVEDGCLTDYLIMPEQRNGFLGVNEWQKPMGTVAGRSTVTNGNFSVADPRYKASGEYQQYGVRVWNKPIGTVSGQSAPGGGAYSVADPRTGYRDSAHQSLYRVVPYDKNSHTVTGATHVAGGAMSVADPRPVKISDRKKGDNYFAGGHYGVTRWDEHTGAISSSAKHDNGSWSVADPRLPAPNKNLVAVIRSIDGTWHRPFTTLELAAIQSLIDPEEHIVLHGNSDDAWRERIGNAVPPDAARAIAEVMGTTLLLAWSGETFVLSSTPIWVQPVAIAMSVDVPVYMQ